MYSTDNHFPGYSVILFLMRATHYFFDYKHFLLFSDQETQAKNLRISHH